MRKSCANSTCANPKVNGTVFARGASTGGTPQFLWLYTASICYVSLGPLFGRGWGVALFAVHKVDGSKPDRDRYEACDGGLHFTMEYASTVAKEIDQVFDVDHED